MDESDAKQQADALIRDLLKAQPSLLGPVAPNEATGAKVAEFITALRAGLTKMYQADK